MKYFALIFLLYFVALAILPCGDRHLECNNTTHETVSHQNQSTPNGRHDLCSPLCTCGCCGTTANFAFQTFKTNDFRPDYSSTHKFPVWNFHFKSNYFANIWQPPRILA